GRPRLRLYRRPRQYGTAHSRTERRRTKNRRAALSKRSLETKRRFRPGSDCLAVEKFENAGFGRGRIAARNNRRRDDCVAMVVEGDGQRRLLALGNRVGPAAAVHP